MFIFINTPLTISELPQTRRCRIISVREGGIDLIRKLDPVDYTHSGAPHSQAQSHVVNLYNFDFSQNSSFSTTLNTMTRTKQAARRGRGGRKSDGANTRPKGDGVAPTPASLIGELLAFLEYWS